MMRMIMLFLPLMIVILREWLSRWHAWWRTFQKKIMTNNLTDRSHYPTISIHFIQNCWCVWLFPHTPSHTHVIPCLCVSSLHVINGKSCHMLPRLWRQPSFKHQRAARCLDRMLLHCWHCCARTGSCHTNANQTMGAEFVHGVLGLKGMGGKTHRTFYPIREVGLKQ